MWKWLLDRFGDARKKQSGVASAGAPEADSACGPPTTIRLEPGSHIDVLLVTEPIDLPPGLDIGRLTVKWPKMTDLPEQLACRELELAGTNLARVPASVRVRDRLDLSGCAKLTDLPDDLVVSSLDLRECTNLKSLPRGIRTHFLNLRGCTGLTSLPEDLSVTIGRLSIRDCAAIQELPASLGPVAQLDLAGCPLIRCLPSDLVVTSSIDIGSTAIRSLPEGSQGARILWRSVPIDERIAFRPHTIRGPEVLAERNAERRRVMLERMGISRFLEEVEAEVLDEDTDRGGPRRLIRVRMEGDEDLVVVSVHCPSTNRHYLLRVPPNMQTCHQAVAWTAGFEDPQLYNPQVET